MKSSGWQIIILLNLKKKLTTNYTQILVPASQITALHYYTDRRVNAVAGDKCFSLRRSCRTREENVCSA